MPGPPFWFVVIVGIATLWAALAFVLHPSERGLSVLRPLCAATVFSALAAFFMGVANGLYGLWRNFPDGPFTPQAWKYVIGFVAEAPAALILGFAIVAVAWLLAAVGLRRQV